MKQTLMILALLGAGAAQAADDAALSRCRSMQDAAPRLACYDAIPLGGPAPAAAAPARQGPESFGIEQRVATQNRIEEIKSHIPGRFEGWTPDTTIVLANGQMWRITDGSTRRVYLDNPKVTVRRAALGSFTMDIEGEGRAPKVRRVQ